MSKRCLDVLKRLKVYVSECGEASYLAIAGQRQNKLFCVIRRVPVDPGRR
jgi:hypothetical protein